MRTILPVLLIAISSIDSVAQATNSRLEIQPLIGPYLTGDCTFFQFESQNAKGESFIALFHSDNPRRGYVMVNGVAHELKLESDSIVRQRRRIVFRSEKLKVVVSCVRTKPQNPKPVTDPDSIESDDYSGEMTVIMENSRATIKVTGFIGC